MTKKRRKLRRRRTVRSCRRRRRRRAWSLRLGSRGIKQWRKTVFRALKALGEAKRIRFRWLDLPVRSNSKFEIYVLKKDSE